MQAKKYKDLCKDRILLLSRLHTYQRQGIIWHFLTTSNKEFLIYQLSSLYFTLVACNPPFVGPLSSPPLPKQVSQHPPQSRSTCQLPLGEYPPHSFPDPPKKNQHAMSTLGGLKATASAGPMHVFLFTSEYDFLPEGVMRIKKIFQKRLSLEGLVSPPLKMLCTSSLRRLI